MDDVRGEGPQKNTDVSIQPSYDSGVIGRFVLRLTAFVGVAGILLGLFEGSDHRIPVLPADASAVGVLPAAVICAIVASIVAEAIRWRGLRASDE